MDVLNLLAVIDGRYKYGGSTGAVVSEDGWEYKDVESAAKLTGTPIDAIKAACRDHAKGAGGVRWAYK